MASIQATITRDSPLKHRQRPTTNMESSRRQVGTIFSDHDTNAALLPLMG
jgi:hypothetical protein